jgi:hypothetical protein
MSHDHEQLRLGIVHHAAEMLATCRLLADEEACGEGKAKYKQLGEYAELVLEQANSTASRAPLFAGRLD